MDPHSVSLVSSSSNPLPTQTVKVTFRGAGFIVATLPGEVLPSWLSVTATTATNGTAQVKLTGDPAAVLNPGRFKTTLRFVAGNADGTNLATTDLPVSLTVPLTAEPSPLITTTAIGAAPFTKTLTLTGVDIAWEARTTVPWISLPTSTGTGSGSLTVAFNPAGLPVGDHVGSVILRDVLTAQETTVPIILGVDAPNIVVTEPGIGLIQVGSRSHLTRTVAIQGNTATPLPWSAVADQPWLRLTPSGPTTPGNLTLAAQTEGLSDGLHLARVTLTTANGPGTTTIRVGLFINANATVQDPVSVELNTIKDLAADPIRPYFYVTHDSQVDFYNGQMGALVGSITIQDATLGAMTCSHDGSALFVADAVTGAIHRINLDTQVADSRFNGARPALSYSWASVDGREVILTAECQAIDAKTGALLADGLARTPVLYPTHAVASPNGRALFVQGGTNGNHHLARFELNARPNVFGLHPTHLFYEPGDGEGLAVDLASSRLYSSCNGYIANAGGTYWGGLAYDSDTFTIVGKIPYSSYGRALIFLPSPDGRLFVNREESDLGTRYTYLDTFGPDFSMVPGTQKIVGESGMMKLSGDAHRVALYTSSYDGKLWIRFFDQP